MFILHLPSWFPNDKNPLHGNFIEKHIAAISKFQKCVTLRVVRVEKKNGFHGISTVNDNNILVEFSILKRSSFLGKVWMKLCEYYFYRKGMKTILQKFGKPQLIHLHVALPIGKIAVRWSKKWKTPLVLTEHWSIYNTNNRGFITPSQQRKFCRIFAALSGITTVSNSLLNNIEELFPVKRSAVIYNVVNTELFIPQKNSNFPKKILHISNLDERAKNFLGILESVQMLRNRRSDFILEVIHDFRCCKAESFVKEQQLEKFVHFLGSMPEEQVAMKMRESDFFLLFSNYENLPCVLLEAISCGKPLITTPVGGIPEIVNEEIGIFVEPDNIQQLTEKLDFMLQHFENFNEYNAHQYAENHFSNEVIGQQFLEFYKSVIHSNHIN